MDNTIMEDNTLRNFDLIMAMCHIIQAEANKIDRCSIQVLATTKDEYMKDTFLEHQEFVENIVRKLDDITAEIFEFENAAAYVNEIDIEMYKPILDQLEEWRKSLKDRVQQQNKWKESLATADLENSLYDIQDGFSDTSYEYRTLGEAIEFIRCTESKPQWKPSDEQIEALNYVVNLMASSGSIRENDYYYNVFKTLREQLEKLK